MAEDKLEDRIAQRESNKSLHEKKLSNLKGRITEIIENLKTFKIGLYVGVFVGIVLAFFKPELGVWKILWNAASIGSCVVTLELFAPNTVRLILKVREKNEEKAEIEDLEIKIDNLRDQESLRGNFRKTQVSTTKRPEE